MAIKSALKRLCKQLQSSTENLATAINLDDLNEAGKEQENVFDMNKNDDGSFSPASSKTESVDQELEDIANAKNAEQAEPPKPEKAKGKTKEKPKREQPESPMENKSDFGTEPEAPPEDEGSEQEMPSN